MIQIRNITTIAKKELKSSFDSPTAYIVLIVFLLLWQFLFFKSAFLINEASLRTLFDYLPWLFLFLIPAITMGAISQEKNEGTLELLLTHPLREWELLLGKFIGSFSFVKITLLFIFPIAFSLSAFGDLDWGIVIGQFLASVCMGMVLVALGIFISSLFSSQITALLTTVVASFFLIIFHTDFITNSLPFGIGAILERLSVSSHFTSMARGVIDLRDIWYFFSAAAVFLGLAYLQLIKRKLGNKKAAYTSWKLGMSLCIGIVILINIIGTRIPGRLDLTASDLYTLSPATEKIVDALDDLVNITLYASQELPAQIKPRLRDIQDILRDYETLGTGNIVVAQKDPSGDLEIEQQANTVGIQEVQFNVINNEEFQVKTGYLGLSVAHGGENEVIPFIENTADLEYQLTSFIAQLTATEKKKIVFLAGHGEKSFENDYQLLSAELSGQFELEEFSFTAESAADEESEEAAPAVSPPKDLPEDTAVLVIAGPNQEISAGERTAIQEYVESGGATLFLLDPVTINMQSLNASANPNSLADLVQDYGVELQPNLVYDLQSHERVGFNQGIFQFFLPYPLWARVLAANEEHPLTARIKSMVLPWSSSLELQQASVSEKNLVATELFTTTEYASSQTNVFSLDPQQNFSQDDLSEYTMGVSIMSAEGSEQNIRLIVIGDSDFLTDSMLQNSAENIAFGMNALAWLAQEDSLAGIRLKQRALSPLVFADETQKSLVKYGNMGLGFFLPFLFGLFRLLRRRRLRKLGFSSKSVR